MIQNTVLLFPLNLLAYCFSMNLSLAPLLPPSTDGHQRIGISCFAAPFEIWELSWAVKIRITPLVLFENPIALRKRTMHNAANRKEPADVSSNNNAIKTCVIELDIFGKLGDKVVVHG